MPTRFITSKTSRLYEASTGRAWEMVLIFGDQVETSGSPVNGRIRAEFRGRPGFIKQDQLGSNAALELYFIDVGQGDSLGSRGVVIGLTFVDGGEGIDGVGNLIGWASHLERGGLADSVVAGRCIELGAFFPDIPTVH